MVMAGEVVGPAQRLYLETVGRQTHRHSLPHSRHQHARPLHLTTRVCLLLPPACLLVCGGVVVYGVVQMEAVDTAFPGFEVEIQGVDKTASGFRLACLRDHDTTPASTTAASSSSAASHKRKGRGGEEGDDKQQQQQGPETGSSSKKR